MNIDFQCCKITTVIKITEPIFRYPIFRTLKKKKLPFLHFASSWIRIAKKAWLKIQCCNEYIVRLIDYSCLCYLTISLCRHAHYKAKHLERFLFVVWNFHGPSRNGDGIAATSHYLTFLHFFLTFFFACLLPPRIAIFINIINLHGTLHNFIKIIFCNRIFLFLSLLVHIHHFYSPSQLISFMFNTSSARNLARTSQTSTKKQELYLNANKIMKQSNLST